jgi:hypothetical protein
MSSKIILRAPGITTLPRLVCIAALWLVLATLVFTAAFAQSASTGSERYCFPAKQWGPSPDGFRPCVRIVRLYEDGSFRFAVSDANGTVRYTAGVGARDR